MNRKSFDAQISDRENLRGEKFRKDYLPIPNESERIASIVVDAAYAVHKTLGAGLLESVYETCFCYELQKHGLKLERQLGVPIIYDGHRLDETLRLDVIVADQIICEIKAVDDVAPVHQAQLLTYMKLTNKQLGFLINFNVPLIKNGIKRMVL